MTRTVLRTELNRQVRSWRSVPGLVYRGPADFVLTEGEWFEPVGCRVGLPKQCYFNALVMGLRGWSYVEGYATSPALPEGWRFEGLEVVPHAWAVDPSGRPWELTWPFVGRAYRGVRFSVGRADDATWNGDACVLDDSNRGWPLLRQAWTGEDWQRRWKRSDGLFIAELYAQHVLLGVSTDAVPFGSARAQTSVSEVGSS